jgi:hypothetical protein
MKEVKRLVVDKEELVEQQGRFYGPQFALFIDECPFDRMLH